jgi:hypothetical protein
MATILTVTDLAEKLATDPRTARKFLRSVTAKEDQPGKGSRWAIEAKQVRSLASKFKKFEAEAAAKVEAKNAEVEVEVETDGESDPEELAKFN